MPEKKTAAKAPPQGEEARVYPAIESFLESNPREAISERFAATREALGQLPKPRAEQGKRALNAIAKTEELLNQLFDTKEKMAKDAKKTRR